MPGFITFVKNDERKISSVCWCVQACAKFGDRRQGGGTVHSCVVSTTAKKCTCASPKNVRAKQKLSEARWRTEADRVKKRSLRGPVSPCSGRRQGAAVHREYRSGRSIFTASLAQRRARRHGSQLSLPTSLPPVRKPLRGGSRQLSATRVQTERTPTERALLCLFQAPTPSTAKLSLQTQPPKPGLKPSPPCPHPIYKRKRSERGELVIRRWRP
jgi:hypothetical protein